MYCRDNIAPSPDLKASFLPSVNQKRRAGLGAAVDSELLGQLCSTAETSCSGSQALICRTSSVIIEVMQLHARDGPDFRVSDSTKSSKAKHNECNDYF